MGVVGRLDQYASMLATEFDETTANNPSITGLGTYYATEFNENIVDIVRDGLVLNLDAGNLASYVGIGTTWTDVSGGGNNGTLVNGPTYSSANGGSIVFDGVNDFIDFTSDSNLLPTAGLTVSAWFKTTVVHRPTLVDKSTGESSTSGYRIIGAADGSIQAYVNGILVQTPSPVTTGNWINLVFTWSPSTSLILYQNSAQVDINTTSIPASITNPSRNIRIAARNTTPTISEYFNGNIAQVSIYNRALTAAEVLQNYNALATRYELQTTDVTAPLSANLFMRQNTDKSVIVYNEIDEITDFRDIVTSGLVLDLDAGMNSSFNNTGTTWTDVSGNGNNGTLTNGPTYSSANGGNIKFDATDDYVTINDSNSLDLTTALTLSLWFNRGDILTLPVGDQHNYIIKGNTQAAGGDQVNYAVGIATTGGRDGSYFWRHPTNGSGTFAPPSSLFSANQWYNLVITHVSGSTPIPYLNGVVQTNWTITAGLSTNPLTANTYKTTICGDAERLAPESNRAATFNGRMSNVSIYNRALTAAEVLQNYNALRNRFGL